MVCLNNKSKWHLDFNGGLVPILETPNGDLIKESGVIMAFAHESGPKQGGISLIPSDPVQAAKMRLEMEAISGKLGACFWGWYMSRGEDNAKIDQFATESLPFLEEICKNSNGQFLFRTEQPTMLDVQVAPFLEFVAILENSPWHNVYERADIKNKAKHLIEYV
jgi:glutathione S-transferase